MQYFIDYHSKTDPRIGALTAADIRQSRIVVVEPSPIPEAELESTATWIKSWGMLANTDDAAKLVNMDVQTSAHAAAK